jgi:hypothetical protein
VWRRVLTLLHSAPVRLQIKPNDQYLPSFVITDAANKARRLRARAQRPYMSTRLAQP